MSSAGFTLAERLGAKSLACTVAGCTRTWISLAGAGKGLKLGGRSAPDPNDPSSGMCDPCRGKFATVTDVQRPCDRAGCAGTWTWPAAAQMAAFATKRPAPVSLCQECEQKLSSLADRPIPCSVAGCARSSVFTRRAQLLAGAPDVEPVPEATMCGPCDAVFKKLKSRQVGCGINGCKHKWTWSAEEQIQDYATGKPNEPPRRMCDECKTVYGAISEREVRCRTSGCKKTWTWARGDQLDSCLAGKPPPKAPARMCPSCLDIYSRVKDVERPCRRSTCKRTWTDKRGAQLARAVRGKTGDPYPHYCTECEKELGELEDRQVPCKTDHCPGTWTWTSAQQLAAGVRPVVKEEAKEEAKENAKENATDDANAKGEPAALEAGAPGAAVDGENAAPAAARMAAAPGQGRKNRNNRNKKKRREPRPPDRRCEACTEFLKDRKTHEIPCSVCSTPIYWPPESQLQTHLGNWSEPSLCGACKRDATEAARALQREALRHPPMPGAQLSDAAAPTEPSDSSPASETPAPEAAPEASPQSS